MNFNEPFVLEENSDYAVVFKPSRMHSVSNKQGEGGTLADWYDGQLMHRLDFETHGLVLFAKIQKSHDFFKALQDKGEFVKEYSAICTSVSNISQNHGFPNPPQSLVAVATQAIPSSQSPQTIMSYFRPYGPGRKLVRPVIDSSSVPNKEVVKDKGGFYRTEIVQKQHDEGKDIFTVRIKRGFRHQIRCHLAWIGRPIFNDPLYNPAAAQEIVGQASPLALRAHALFFTDPSTGEKREYRIEPIMI